MLFAALLESAVLLVLLNLFYRFVRRGGIGAQLASIASVLVLSPCLWQGVQVVFLNGLLVTIAMAICARARAFSFTFFKVSLAVTAGIYLLIGLLSLKPLYDGYEWQARYPFESMTARLAYEKTKSRPFRFKEVNAGELEGRTDEDRYNLRTHMLKNIHRTAVERFIDSPGFGMARNVALDRPDRIERESKREYLPDLPANGDFASPPDDNPPAPASERVPAGAPLLTALEFGHRVTRSDFVDVYGFGYFRDREHVAGFRPHGLHDRPYFRVWPEPALEVTRLELVSLLKFDEPRVYVLPHSFPRMDRLSDGTTRSPDAFENSALASLQTGEDLVADTTGNRVRLVGSIRAVNQCLACHSVERGELLGAFTYQLRKVATAPIASSEQK